MLSAERPAQKTLPVRSRSAPTGNVRQRQPFEDAVNRSQPDFGHGASNIEFRALSQAVGKWHACPWTDDAISHTGRHRDRVDERSSALSICTYNSCHHGGSLGPDFAAVGDVGHVSNLGALLFGRTRRSCAWRFVSTFPVLAAYYGAGGFCTRAFCGYCATRSAGVRWTPALIRGHYCKSRAHAMTSSQNV
jgi:hypothetical protein